MEFMSPLPKFFSVILLISYDTQQVQIQSTSTWPHIRELKTDTVISPGMLASLSSALPVYPPFALPHPFPTLLPTALCSDLYEPWTTLMGSLVLRLMFILISGKPLKMIGGEEENEVRVRIPLNSPLQRFCSLVSSLYLESRIFFWQFFPHGSHSFSRCQWYLSFLSIQPRVVSVASLFPAPGDITVSYGFPVFTHSFATNAIKFSSCYPSRVCNVCHQDPVGYSTFHQLQVPLSPWFLSFL